MSKLPAKNELKKLFIINYIKDHRKRAMYELAEKAERTLETVGQGYCCAAAIYGINLMDDIIIEYVDGHYITCIFLCRSRTELVLRESLYFRWFLQNKKQQIKAYLKKWVRENAHDKTYLSNKVKYENLTNNLIFEYFEKIRPDLESELVSKVKTKVIRNGKSLEKEIYELPLGTLINHCRDNKLVEKRTLKTLEKINKLGNFYVHGKYLKPGSGYGILRRPILQKNPKESAKHALHLTADIMNCIFGDYPYKVLYPKEKLFSLKIPKK